MNDPALKLERKLLVRVTAILDSPAVNDGLLDDLADMKAMAALFQTAKAKKLLAESGFPSRLLSLIDARRIERTLLAASLRLRVDSEEHPSKVEKRVRAFLDAADAALEASSAAGLDLKKAAAKLSKAVKSLDAAADALGPVPCTPEFSGTALGTGPNQEDGGDDWTLPAGLQSFATADVTGATFSNGGQSRRLEIGAAFSAGRFTAEIVIADTNILQQGGVIGLLGNPGEPFTITLTDALGIASSSPNIWNLATGSFTVDTYDAPSRVLSGRLSALLSGGQDDMGAPGNQSALYLDDVTISVCGWTDE
ncbi:MAG: hypothetical protein HMLKMBBP_02472 [Planctomycetes bacterium]|nr:hypothetical protein [Planctomycetota bacterium]